MLDFIPDTPVRGASQSQSNGPVMEERAGSPDQIPMEVQVSVSTCVVHLVFVLFCFFSHSKWFD